MRAHVCVCTRHVTAISNEVLYFQLCSWRFAIVCKRACSLTCTARMNMKLVSFGRLVIFLRGLALTICLLSFFTVCQSKPIFCLLIILKELVTSRFLPNFILIIHIDFFLDFHLNFHTCRNNIPYSFLHIDLFSINMNFKKIQHTRREREREKLPKISSFCFVIIE